MAGMHANYQKGRGILIYYNSNFHLIDKYGIVGCRQISNPHSCCIVTEVTIYGTWIQYPRKNLLRQLALKYF